MGVKIPGDTRVGGGLRAAITRFSGKSRKLLLDFLNQVDQTKVRHEQIAFGTLTYPEKFPCARVSKKHLGVFLKRVARKYPACPLIWKLEPQKRGAPHFHFLLIMPEVISDSVLQDLIQWTASNWVEVVGSGDPLHLAWHLGQLGRGNKPCVESVRSWEGVMSYAGKYLAKLTPRQYEHFEHPGRWWGIINRKCFPRTLVRRDLTMGQAVLVRRQIRRMSERQLIDRFYVPGCPRISGAHSPGQILHGDTLLDLRGTGPARPVRHQIEDLERVLGRKIRQQRRRVFRGSGGISIYMNPADAERLLTWAKRVCPGDPPPCPERAFVGQLVAGLVAGVVASKVLPF